MTSPSLYQQALAQIYKSYSQDVGKALVHMGTAGWLFSAIAQVAMIATNKNMDKKEKQFLIPQEIADGAINVGLFFTVSKLIKDYADKLVETGKISLKKTDAIIDRLNNTNMNNNLYIKDIADKYAQNVRNSNIDETVKKSVLNRKSKYTSLFYEKAISELENLSTQKNNIFKNKTSNLIAHKADQNLLNALKQGQKEFLGFKNGVGVIAAIAASVLASNIITPVCRNIVANKCQDSCKKHEQKSVYNNMPINPVFNAQLMSKPATFGAFRI